MKVLHLLLVPFIALLGQFDHLVHLLGFSFEHVDCLPILLRHVQGILHPRGILPNIPIQLLAFIQQMHLILMRGLEPIVEFLVFLSQAFKLRGRGELLEHQLKLVVQCLEGLALLHGVIVLLFLAN